MIAVADPVIQFTPKSVLMTEQSELKLYAGIRHTGGFMRAENMYYYDEEINNCICVKLTDHVGETYPIQSLKYTKYNDVRGTEPQ